MPYRNDDDRALIFMEDHSPIADTQACSIAPLKTLHIATSRGRKFH